jgi:hypothetical protein
MAEDCAPPPATVPPPPAPRAGPSKLRLAVVACRARQAVHTSPYSVQDIPLPVSPPRGGAMGIQLSPVDEGKTKGPAQASASKCGRHRVQ